MDNSYIMDIWYQNASLACLILEQQRSSAGRDNFRIGENLSLNHAINDSANNRFVSSLDMINHCSLAMNELAALQRSIVPPRPIPDILYYHPQVPYFYPEFLLSTQTVDQTNGSTVTVPRQAYQLPLTKDKQDEKTTKNAKKTTRKRGTYPADRPRHPLNAYNFFFSDERDKILHNISSESISCTSSNESSFSLEHNYKDFSNMSLEEKQQVLKRYNDRSEERRKRKRPHRKSHGMIAFQELASTIAQRWRALPDERRAFYLSLADMNTKNYQTSMNEYKISSKRVKTK